MSFSATKRRAQDESRHINSRRVSVRSCIQLCLYYSGSNGYKSIVAYYNQNHNLNGNDLTSETIDNILNEISDLREQSKRLQQGYHSYRRIQKLQGYRTVSKSDHAICLDNWKMINQLWDRFDTEKTDQRKALEFWKLINFKPMNSWKVLAIILTIFSFGMVSETIKILTSEVHDIAANRGSLIPISLIITFVFVSMTVICWQKSKKKNLL